MVQTLFQSSLVRSQSFSRLNIAQMITITGAIAVLNELLLKSAQNRAEIWGSCLRRTELTVPPACGTRLNKWELKAGGWICNVVLLRAVDTDVHRWIFTVSSLLKFNHRCGGVDEISKGLARRILSLRIVYVVQLLDFCSEMLCGLLWFAVVPWVKCKRRAVRSV